MQVRSLVVDGEKFLKKMAYREGVNDPYTHIYVPEDIWDGSEFTISFRETTNKEDTMNKVRSQERTKFFGFDKAIGFLKDGNKLSRAGWYGKNMWIELTELNCEGVSMYNEYPIVDHILMKTAQDYYTPWMASQSDLLDEDWFLVE
jgi:hypothetical protein